MVKSKEDNITKVVVEIAQSSSSIDSAKSKMIDSIVEAINRSVGIQNQATMQRVMSQIHSSANTFRNSVVTLISDMGEKVWQEAAKDSEK